MNADLSALLTSSKALTSQLHKPDLPHVNLSLDQIEAQSRRLVSRQPGGPADSTRANYLLAQAHVDAPALASSIAHLNTVQTFSPLQPLQDTDVSGYLRHAHEQSIISTIEESRRETQNDFYRALDERARRDWEARKKRVFEELGGQPASSDNRALTEYGKSGTVRASLALSTGPAPSVQAQSKMMAYDRPISELNAARLKGSSFPIIHALAQASLAFNSDPMNQITQNFLILAKIAAEPPALAPLEHAGAHLLNTMSLERKQARAYLGDPHLREAVELRKQIASGAREALEEQYLNVLERTIQARPLEAKLGGDPSAANKVRAFLLVRYYRGGEWQDRIELVASQPLWAKLFYLVRIGQVDDALSEALRYQQAIEHREDSFVSHFRAWLESPDRRLPKVHRDHIQSIYNAHMLHSATVDPFKLALYKLMGRLEPTRRTVPLVTSTTEDWLWFQLAMVDEEDNNGLSVLAETLLGYGQRHFEGPQGQKGTRTGLWSAVLLMCGQFERAVAALYENSETYVEGVHMAIALAYHGLLRVPSRSEMSDVTPLSIPADGRPPALCMQTVIWRYVRQFVKMDAKEALQYVYAVTLGSDQPGPAGPEQLELAWDLVRRIVVLANAGPAWDELVGGFRPDGSRFPGAIAQAMPLLKLSESAFHEKILLRAARDAEDADRPLEAIKLYNLAGDYGKVVACLAQSLGATVSAPAGGGQAGRELERTAREIVHHYERTNRAGGRQRDAVVKLLKIREAMEMKAEGRYDVALEILESTDLLPADLDMAKMTRRAEEFKEMDDSLARNAGVYIPLAMDCIVAVYRTAKQSMAHDASRNMTLTILRTKAKALTSFAGMIRYRLSSEMHTYLQKLNVEMGV